MNVADLDVMASKHDRLKRLAKYEALQDLKGEVNRLRLTDLDRLRMVDTIDRLAGEILVGKR